MAENTKKYLDLDGLEAYDELLKSYIESADNAVASAAASDAQSKATAAQTAAKSYTDTEVAKANAAAAAAQNQADKGVSDAAAAAAAAATADGKAVVAKAAADLAQEAADKAQGEVDALETYVGTFVASDGVDTVVKYIDEKTKGIASEGAMNLLSNRVKAIEDDYLVEADKTELVAAIATAKEEAIEAVLDGVTDNFDTLKEVAAWIQADTTRAAELTTRVSTAEGEIDTLQSEMDAVEGRMDTAEAEIDALQALFGEGEGSVSDQIADAVAAEAALRIAGDQAAEASAADALSAAQAAQREVDALEGVVSALDGVVATKATKSEHDALAGRVSANETAIANINNHSHANKDVIDGITADLISQWNLAHTNNHTHSNKAVLDGITSAKVTAWDKSLQDAKDYADEKFVIALNYITTTEIDALFNS